MRAARIRKSARIAGGTLLAAALLPWVGLSAAQAADVSTFDSRALHVDRANVNKCPAGTVELLAEDGESQYVTIGAVDGHTVTHIYVKGGNGYHVYEPGERGLEGAPWVDLRSPDNRGDNVPVISHVLVCGVKTPVETTTTTPPSETTTQPPSETVTTTPPSETSTTTPPSETTTATPPSETSTTTPPSEATTTTTPPSETSTTSPTDDTEVLGTKTSAPPTTAPTVEVLGTKVTASPGTQVLGTKVSALPRTGGDIARAVAVSAALMITGLGLLFASGSLRRRPREH